MRRSAKGFFLFGLICGLLVTPGLALPASSAGTAAGESKKVIAVVLDDSTSMVRDSNKKEDYTTRWVEADYSVRALAAMMDSGDILRVYTLNEPGYFSITAGQDDLKRNLFDKLDNVEFFGGTKFTQVQKAAEFLRGERGKERFLVVIADGNFEDASSAVMSQERLNEAFREILTPGIKTHYIQIGSLGSGSCVPSIPEVNVHYGNSQKITRQITDVLNEIYHRVAMEEADKKALITHPSEDDLTISFNIPVQNATIFLQGSADWAAVQHSAAPYTLKLTEVSQKPRETLELWERLGTEKREWIRTTELSGLVISCGAPNMGSTEPITVSGVPGLDEDSIQVYYEPAVEQQVTVTQRDGLSFVYGQMDPPLFVEGPVDISIDYLGLDGKALDLRTASMLRTESTTVEVNGRLFSGVPQEDGRYVYSGALSAADAGSSIAISNAIGMNGGKWSLPLGEIYEPNMSLALELVQDSSVLTLDKEGGAVLLVAINDAAVGAPPEKRAGMAVTCDSEHFHADTEHFNYENGVLQIPLTLKDPEEHQINQTERFTVEATVPYSDGVRPPASVEKVFSAVTVTSLPHELTAESGNTSAKLIYVAVLGKTFPVTYSCDGEVLSKEQLEDADISLSLQSEDLEKLVTLKNGNIGLKRQLLQWKDIRDGEYEAELTFFYTKWNQPSQITVPITLDLTPITWWHIFGLFILLLLTIALLIFLVWFVLWYAFWTETKNGDYIRWDTIFELVNKDDPTGRTQLNWSWYSKRFFRANFWGKRYAHIRRRVMDETDEGPLPKRIDLYIAREGDRWRLGKIDSRMRPALDECDVRIGGVSVSRDSCRFLAGGSFQNRLEFKRSSQEHPWYLKITENE